MIFIYVQDTNPTFIHPANLGNVDNAKASWGFYHHVLKKSVHIVAAISYIDPVSKRI